MQTVTALDAAEFEDGFLAACQSRVLDLLGEDRPEAAGTAYRRFREVRWMVDLMAEVGRPSMVHNADLAVREVFEKFCRHRDTVAGAWDLRAHGTGVPDGEERLLLSALMRIACSIVFAPDLDEQIRWICDAAGAQLRKATEALTRPEPGRHRLGTAFSAHGLNYDPGPFDEPIWAPIVNREEWPYSPLSA
ncbi:hypothetical protein OG225_42230 (plasmid) [Nocardia sp. NBC_01377]|uniref:hypothetical protein n=1 Tax=Nocardia sp. NBC_01377 TaxID=2903595 RepID=UPI002F915E7C